MPDFGSFMGELIKEGMVIQTIHAGQEDFLTSQVMWRLANGKIKCPRGNHIDLHDPETFKSQLTTLKKAIEECGKSHGCVATCQLRHRELEYITRSRNA